MGCIPSSFRAETSELRDVRCGVTILVRPEAPPEQVMIETDPFFQGVSQHHGPDSAVADWVAFCPVARGFSIPDDVRGHCFLCSSNLYIVVPAEAWSPISARYPLACAMKSSPARSFHAFTIRAVSGP